MRPPPPSRLAHLVLAALLVAPALAAADQRPYAFTYPAVTAPRGGLDLEFHSLYSDPREGPRQWEHQVELEYGITDRWDVALYNVFTRPYGGPFRYEAAKLETRLRLADAGEWPVDVVLYGEIEQSVVDDKPTTFEEKLIVAKDLGRANLAVNLVAEQEIAKGKTELEWGWSAGASWEVHPALRLGGETFGNVRTVDQPTGESRQTRAWAGPAVAVSLPAHGGVLKGSALTVTAAFGLNHESDPFLLRGILAFHF